MRSTASFLHVTGNKGFPESPFSASSTSKKPGRFPDCYIDKASSPIEIPGESPKIFLDFYDAPILTARPSLEMSVLEAACELASPSASPVRQTRPISDLPTPMPGTNLPMEDPFQDIDRERDTVVLPVASKSLRVTFEDGFVSKEDEERTGGHQGKIHQHPHHYDSIIDVGYDLGRLHELPSSGNLYDQTDNSQCSDPRDLTASLPRYEDHQHDLVAPSEQLAADNDLSQRQLGLLNTLSDVSNETTEPSFFQEFVKQTVKVPYRKSRVEIGFPLALTATPSRVCSASIDNSSVRHVSGDTSTTISRSFRVEGAEGENGQFFRPLGVQDDSVDT